MKQLCYILPTLFVLLGSANAENSSPFDVPTVNYIFGNAYYRSDNNSQASFWLGVAIARCSAAASLASDMNDGMEKLFADKRKGYFGNQPPSYWKDVSSRSKQASLVMLEHSGHSQNETLRHFEIIAAMSKELYFAQLNTLDKNGFPNWSMLNSDLEDCSSFFEQDSTQSKYRPRKGN